MDEDADGLDTDDLVGKRVPVGVGVRQGGRHRAERQAISVAARTKKAGTKPVAGGVATTKTRTTTARSETTGTEAPCGSGRGSARTSEAPTKTLRE